MAAPAGTRPRLRRWGNSGALTDAELRAQPLEVTGITGGGGGSAAAAPTYDSGLITLPAILTELTTETITSRRLLLTNLTTATQLVTVTNTAGAFYLKDFALFGKMTIALDLGYAEMVGVKWQAGAAASVNAQLVGDLPGIVSTPYDSGLVTLTDTLAALTASSVDAARLLLVNLTTLAQAVTVRNSAGGYYLKAYPLQAKMTVPLDLGGATMAGVQWHAGANNAVNAQLVGDV